MVGFQDLIRTGIAPNKKKPAVKVFAELNFLNFERKANNLMLNCIKLKSGRMVLRDCRDWLISYQYFQCQNCCGLKPDLI